MRGGRNRSLGDFSLTLKNLPGVFLRAGLRKQSESPFPMGTRASKESLLLTTGKSVHWREVALI